MVGKVYELLKYVICKIGIKSNKQIKRRKMTTVFLYYPQV